MRFLKHTILVLGNDAWDDYRISKVQSRSQLWCRFWSKRRNWEDCDQVGSYSIRIIFYCIHNIVYFLNTHHMPLIRSLSYTCLAFLYINIISKQLTIIKLATYTSFTVENESTLFTRNVNGVWSYVFKRYNTTRDME